MEILTTLRALADPTRLRLLDLLGRAELTVSEITRVLGQSQPRVSRHLKLLCDAGLLTRTQEGTWAFYRVSEAAAASPVVSTIMDELDTGGEQLALDRRRLAALKEEVAAAAATYFEAIAGRWDQVRELYVGEEAVECAIVELLGSEPVADLLDLGTGTGRMLELLGEAVARGIGIDSSREMLALARAKIDRSGLRHCRVRRGDVYRLDVVDGSQDLVTIHHVLHFLDDPAGAVEEAARTLRAGGRLLVVDFAPHRLELLRTEHAHRRLGFADAEVADWCRRAGLVDVDVRHLSMAESSAEERLTVSLWVARQSPDAPSVHPLERAS